MKKLPCQVCLFVTLAGFFVSRPAYSFVIAQNRGQALRFKPNSPDTITTLADSLALPGFGTRISQQNSRRSLALFLKVNQHEASEQRGSRFYYRLAGVFAKFRLYSLAMKSYFKTLPVVHHTDTIYTKTTLASNLDEVRYISPNAIQQVTVIRTDITQSGAMALTNNDLALLQSSGVSNKGREDIKSLPISISHITDPFSDGKQAAAYAMLIHIRQPVSGKGKVFTRINQVGHTFVTLIKYNNDSSFVSRSFGFYPKKNFFLDGTPIHPSSSSVFKNDSLHNWDEMAGKFISRRQFNRILNTIKSYEGRKYNLNNNNCTDFGLAVATQAGIYIMNTQGSWPLGKGNNPGSAGQSMLMGNVQHNNDSLLLLNDLVEH